MIGRLEKSFLVAGFVGTLALGGCVSLGAKPYTLEENLLFGAAVTAHTVDMAATRYGSDRGLLEGSSLYGKDAEIDRLLDIKLAYLGMVYGLGEILPWDRKLMYTVVTITGTVPFLWNVFNIITYSLKNE